VTLVPAVRKAMLESMALRDQKAARVIRGHPVRKVLLDCRVISETQALLVEQARVDLKELRVQSDLKDCKDQQVCYVTKTD